MRVSTKSRANCRKPSRTPEGNELDEAAEGWVEDVLNTAVGKALAEDADSGQEPVIITSAVLKGQAAKVQVNTASDADLLVLGSDGPSRIHRLTARLRSASCCAARPVSGVLSPAAARRAEQA
jgi:hypothetical protein